MLVFVILIITCAEITIVMCYFQLCAEDYHWWWRAFLTSGSSAVYMFVYSIFYFFTKLEITKFVSLPSASTRQRFPFLRRSHSHTSQPPQHPHLPF